MFYKTDLYCNKEGKIEAFKNELKEFYTVKNLAKGVKRMSRDSRFVELYSLRADDFYVPIKAKEKKEFFSKLWDCICDLIMMHDREVDRTGKEVPYLFVKPLDKHDEVRLKMAAWYINVGVHVDYDLEDGIQGDLCPVTEEPSPSLDANEDEMRDFLEFTDTVEREIYGSVPQDP